MLLPFLFTQVPSSPVATSVQAFGLYAGDKSYPNSDASFRTGTLVIVRQARSDGTTTTRMRTFSVVGHHMALRSVSGGSIVRDAQGEIEHIDVWAKSPVPTIGNEGNGSWDRTKKDDVLTGWSQSAWDDRHPVTLPNDAVYSLGAVEALTYDPTLSTWRVPSPSDTHRVSSGIETGRPFSQYRIGAGTWGRYWYRGSETTLRVCPVYLKDDVSVKATVNGRPVPANHAAIALFDELGHLVGFGYSFHKSNDVDSQDWGGKTEGFLNPPATPTAPDPFATLFVSSLAAPISLSPAEEADVLKSM